LVRSSLIRGQFAGRHDSALQPSTAAAAAGYASCGFGISWGARFLVR
jgi:hypothetical protein